MKISHWVRWNTKRTIGTYKIIYREGKQSKQKPMLLNSLPLTIRNDSEEKELNRVLTIADSLVALKNEEIQNQGLISRSINISDIMFFEFAKEVISEYSNMNTVKNAKLSISKFLLFIDQHDLVTDKIAIMDISVDLVREFKTFLESKKKDSGERLWKDGYIQRIFNFLLNVFNKAIKYRKIPNVSNPFNAVKLTRSKVKIEYLDLHEIKRIYNLDLSEYNRKRETNFGTYSKIVDVQISFIISILTGMRYSDTMIFIETLSEQYLTNGEYLGEQIKTGNHISFSFRDDMIKLLKRYGRKPEKFSNQKGNDNLKRIAKLAGIDKHLHWHISRHSYVTLMMSQGYGYAQIGKHLGTSAKILEERYAHLDKSLRDRMSNAIPDLSSTKKLQLVSSN